MLLYHGTSAAVARLALTEGLKPRADLEDLEGNWKDNPSSPFSVYMTSAYALYFAMAASGEDDEVGIVEIDTDKLPGMLLPDEDFLEQASRAQDLPSDPFWDDLKRMGSMEARTRWFRNNLLAFAHAWEDSIKGLGNCAHDGAIPAHAVTRVSIFKPSSNRTISMMSMDPSISTMNFRFCGAKYQALTQWAVGHDVDPLAFTHFGMIPQDQLEDMPDELRQSFEQQASQMSQVLSERGGLEVLLPGNPE
jgi:hypothetical protein